MTQQLRIGDTLPTAAGASYFGRQIEPRWLCVVTSPGSSAHADCRAFIRANGMFAFYPSTERTTKRRGRTYTAETPLAPGYVFAQFLAEPLWHVWSNHKWFHHVFRIGENPYAFDYAQIRHLQGMTVDAERLRRAQEAMQAELDAALRPVAGSPAKIVSGPLEGHTITPHAIVKDEAIFDLFGVRVRANLSTLRRA